MKYQFSSYDIGYPLYGAKFLNNSVLLVTGGGGHKNPDIPSKLTALRIDFNKKRVIKRFREITFDSKDDHPTTLDAAEVINQDPLHNIILVGCNETASSSATTNYHLRKFAYENDHLKFMVSADFNRSNDPNVFTKFSSLSSDGTVGAIASSKLPVVIRIIDPMTMEEKYEIETGSEVKDLHFSPDGKVICYITETTLEVISIVTGRFIVRKTDFKKNITLSKVRFLSNDMVVVVGSLKEKAKKIIISKINIKTKNTTVLLSKSIKSNYTSITAMDSSKDGQLICLATNEKTLLIIKAKDFTVLRSFKNVHQNEITAVAFSPDVQYIASVSLSNTVHLVKLPPGLAVSTSFLSKLFKLLLNILFTIGIIIVAYLAYYFELHHKTYRYVNEKYLTKRDTSGYFQMHDGFLTTSMDIVDDIVTIHTLTGKINTGSDVDTKKWSTNIPLTSISADYGNKMYDEVSDTFIPEFDVSTKTKLQSSSKSSESSTLLSVSNMEATTSLYVTSSSISPLVTSVIEPAFTKGSISTSLTGDYQSSESGVVETYNRFTSSEITPVSRSLQEMEPSSITDSRSRSGSTNISLHQKSSNFSPSSVSEDKLQHSNSAESENTSSLTKQTIIVDGVVYEVVSMSPAPTTSSYKLSSKETSDVFSSESVIGDNLIFGDRSGISTTTNIKSSFSTIPNAMSISKDKKYDSANSETTSTLMISDSRNNSTSSYLVTQSTTSNDMTFSTIIVSDDLGKESITNIKSEEVTPSSIFMITMINTNPSSKVSIPEGKKDLSVSSIVSISSDITTVDKELQSNIGSITGIGIREKSNSASTSVFSTIENSSLGSPSYDKIENLKVEESVTSNFPDTLPSKNIASTELKNNTVEIIETKSYTPNDTSSSCLLNNTSFVISPTYKKDGHQSNNSITKVSKSLTDNTLSTISFTSQKEIPILSVQKDNSIVLSSAIIRNKLENVTADANEVSLKFIPKIDSSISQVVESTVYPVNTIDSHTFADVTSIAPSVTTSGLSDLLMKTQSDIVVSSTKGIDDDKLLLEIDKEANAGFTIPSDSDNIIVNQTFDTELLHPPHDEL